MIIGTSENQLFGKLFSARDARQSYEARSVDINTFGAFVLEISPSQEKPPRRPRPIFIGYSFGVLYFLAYNKY